MKTKLVGIGLALALFVTGAVVGAVMDRSWGRDTVAAESTTHRPSNPNWRHKRHQRMIKRFRKRLSLTDEQAAAVSKILTDSRSNLRTIRNTARQDIKKLLNPSQVNIYEKMVKRRERRRRRGRRGRRGRRHR